MEIETGLLSVMLHFAVCTFLLSAILLCIRRHPNHKSRVYLAAAFFIAVAAFGLRLFAGYAGRPLMYAVLPIDELYGGLLALLIHYLYPIQVINPGWLTFKRVLYLFAPWLLLSLLLMCVPIHFRQLLSFGDIIEYISEFNVWFRLLILLAGIIPYCFMLFYIPYNYKKSSADCRWIFIYTVGIQGIGFFFTLFMLTRSTVISILHVTYCISFCLFITYQELFVRISVPANVPKTPASPARVETIVQQKAEENPLWTQLNELMDREQLWRNPDTNASNLAMLLKTNRNRITQLIQEKGYEGYKEFINRRRIDEFLKIADNGNLISVQDTFFSVGFRSKMTALRYFKEYTGMTPSEYLQLKFPKEIRTL